jgi:hypothetical protein
MNEISRICCFNKEDNKWENIVGMFYRKRVLVIDGKNNNDDGKQEKHKLRRRSEQYAEIEAQKGKCQYKNVIRIKILDRGSASRVFTTVGSN